METPFFTPNQDLSRYRLYYVVTSIGEWLTTIPEVNEPGKKLTRNLKGRLLLGSPERNFAFIDATLLDSYF